MPLEKGISGFFQRPVVQGIFHVLMLREKEKLRYFVILKSVRLKAGGEGEKK